MSNLTKSAISTYTNAQSLPTPLKLRALERAFKLKKGELLPGFDPEQPLEAQPAMPEPRILIRAIDNRPGFVRLIVNADVPSKLAYEIGAMIEEPNAKTAARK